MHIYILFCLFLARKGGGLGMTENPLPSLKQNFGYAIATWVRLSVHGEYYVQVV